MKKKNSLMYKILNEFEVYLGTILFIVITVLLSIQVISRYVFNNALSWTEELSCILFVWMIYLGVAAAVNKRKHLRIDALLDAMPFKMKKFTLILGNVIFIFFCGYIIFPINQLISNLVRSGTVTAILRIPKMYTYSIMPVCLALTIIRLVQESLILFRENEQELGAAKPTIDMAGLELEANKLREEKAKRGVV